MQDCPVCGIDNPEDALFCRGCGARLSREVICPECGRPNACGSRFCNGCGKLLADEAPTSVPATGPADDSPTEELLIAGDASPSGGGGNGRLPADRDWTELARLVNELALEPGALIPAPPLESASPPVISETQIEDEPREEVELALADAMAGNGTGPRLPFRPPVFPRVDGDKATGLMANALASAPTAYKVSRKRQPWRVVSE